MPHAESWPESLWWYVHYPGERKIVIDSYLAKYARGKKIPEDFHDELTTCLKDLSHIQNLKEWGKPRTNLYWTIPTYARAHRLNPFTLMKRLREMEKIAKEMYPARAEGRGRRIDPLTESEKAAIRRKCLKGENIKDIAQKHNLTPAHVGQICRTEKQLRWDKQKAERIEREAPVDVGFDDPAF
jgi:hypothetical protein